MKYLIALSFFQAAVLAFLGLRVMEIDARTDDIAVIVEASANQSGRSAADPFPAQSAAIRDVSVEQIRQLLREEIAAINNQNLAQPTRRTTQDQAANKNNAGAGPVAASEADQFYLRGDVVRDIDNFIGLGRIEPSEMADLQIKMARLSPEDQRAMLTRLTKAMNAGDLEGEF